MSKQAKENSRPAVRHNSKMYGCSLFPGATWSTVETFGCTVHIDIHPICVAHPNRTLKANPA
ncbi:uncharacterized protein METZ01_LOCUS110038 [marine metagenome]|uniref:Uncharacterized protein n=1 Tax=marine metagenome TaxID=408172 RepID=A0A381WXE4_9ZZZZ